MTKEEFEEQAAALQARRQAANKPEPRHYNNGQMHSYRSDRQRLGNKIAEHASEWMQEHYPRQLQFDAADLQDALGDAFLIRANLPIRHAVHPLSSWASELSLQRLADQLQVRSLSSSEFAIALASGFARIVQYTYDGNDSAGALVQDVVVPNFHPAEFPKCDAVDLLEVSKTANPESGNIPLQLLNLAGAETGAVNTWRARILVGRSLILSDSFNLISTLLQQLSAQAARLPQQLIAKIISDNSNLADGQPLLGSSNTAAAGVNLTGLGSAASILRLVHSDADNVLNLGPAVLLTRPENEMTWRSVLRSIELTGQPNIRLVSNSWLPTTSNFSYLLASPEESPVFVRMVFAKPLKPSVTSGQLPIEYDGTYLDFSVDFGIKAVSRLGLVRIPTT